MPLVEDLSVFFNVEEHAISATIKTPQGATLRTASVIFSEPVNEVPLRPGEVTTQQPFLQCPTADLDGVKAEYVFDIGAKSYAVVRWEHDGTGVSVVHLRKR